jgi:hypothetical protein
LIGRSETTVERLIKDSQGTATKIRSRLVSQGGHRFKIYHRAELLNFVAGRNVGPPNATGPVEKPSLADQVQQALQSLADVVRREIGRGVEDMKVELHSGEGEGSIRVRLEVGEDLS